MVAISSKSQEQELWMYFFRIPDLAFMDKIRIDPKNGNAIGLNSVEVSRPAEPPIASFDKNLNAFDVYNLKYSPDSQMLAF